MVIAMAAEPIDRLTTAQAAKVLHITQGRVLQLIRAGRLPTVRAGPLHLIDAADLEKVKVRKPGRPWPAKPKPAKRRKRK
jgi:excisionase family DNA binding protein